jgi:hypothetical protein
MILVAWRWPTLVETCSIKLIIQISFFGRYLILCKIKFTSINTLRPYFMSKRKATLWVNVAFEIVCWGTKPKALKTGLQLPAWECYYSSDTWRPAWSGHPGCLSVACDSPGRVGWLYVPETDTHTAHLANKMRSSPCGLERVTRCFVANTGIVRRVRECT